ncbi:MAG: GTP pyrophosphokinase family protein [Lachnospiraceae bacterium]|nr:GTP pyrophosphokinase family protein [Lachnospiraceae bacterium]MDD3614987.1 GTP pyrophosphokinase family protein [Lachnospiraceae bacterium]
MEIRLWREIVSPYELAVKELTTKFNHLIHEYQEKNQYSPIESVSGRVKSISSILEKMQRKQIPFERMEEEVEDIAGIRIICQFVEDIETVAQIVANRSDMIIKSEKDYIKNMKPSGYRSYHLIIYYTVETMDGPRKIQAELQIRTMAMNFWATIEHSLQYKYKTHIPEHITSRLSNAADAIIALDKEMSTVRSEIMDAQISSQTQLNLVMEILNNIENLYKLSNKREVVKIQDEFYRIYAMNDMTQLERFSKQLDIIAEGYRAQAIDSDLS